jgi:hypothetical protein
MDDETAGLLLDDGDRLTRAEACGTLHIQPQVLPRTLDQDVRLIVFVQFEDLRRGRNTAGIALAAVVIHDDFHLAMHPQ